VSPTPARLALRAAPALAVLAVLGGPAIARADETDACIQASDEGQVLRDKGKLLAARARFLACSRDACPRLVRADCAGWLADVDARTPSVVVSAEDPAGADAADVRVTMDGAPFLARLDGRAIPVDPGEHRFRFERAGSAAVEETAILREGERRRTLVVRFRAVDEARPSAGPGGAVIAAIVLGGAALAGGGIFAYLGATAESERNALRTSCAPGCKPAQVDAVRYREIAANVALGAGLAAAATAVVLLVVRPGEAKPAARIDLVPMAGGGALRIGGTF
jgi:hypothetical protein